MKKNRWIAGILVLLVLLTSGFNNTTKVEAAKPSVKAYAYVVLDANANNNLYTYKPNKKIYPASTVKIMTAIVALENAKPTKKIRFTKAMRKEVKTTDIYHLGLKVGAKYSVEQYLNMLLMASDADSAIALARGISGSTKKFVKLMNKKAKELGLSNTAFDNPIGLDIGNGYKNTYTTANDFTQIARYAMSVEMIRDIAAKESYKVSKTSTSKAFTIKNTNAFYSGQEYDNTLYQIIGLKTGTTSAAGSVLIAVAKDEEGHEVICSFFGKGSNSDKYRDIRNLLNYTFRQNQKGKIVLSRGFWDVRYRSSAAIIGEYANTDMYDYLEGENGKFEPDSVLPQLEALALLNALAGTNLVKAESENTADVLILSDVAVALGKVYPQTMTAEEMAFYTATLTNLPQEPEQQQAIAAMYKNGIVTSDFTNDTAHILTKEEVVLLADAIRKWIVSQSI